MQVASGQAGHVTQKLIDDCVPIGGRNLFITVNFVKVESRFSKRCGIYSSGNKFYKADWGFFEGMKPNGPVVWGVAVCVGVGMCFCKVPISGDKLAVTIKLSR